MLTILVTIAPVMISQFTDNLVLAPILTFFVVLGYWGLNEICAELENPYGEDPNDLDLIEMHRNFAQGIKELMQAQLPISATERLFVTEKDIEEALEEIISKGDEPLRRSMDGDE